MKKLLLSGIGLVLVLVGIVWLATYYPPERDSDAQDALGKDAEGGEYNELPAIELVSRTVALDSGEERAFRIADPFKIAVAAEGLGKARFMTMSPDGRLFVPDMVNYNLSHEGKVFVLEDFDEETGRFKTKHTYLSGLRGPNSIAFYTDPKGNDWIYVALTAHLIRYPYHAGDMAPTDPPEIIVTFPNTQTPGETSVVWHITRTILFHDDRFYISLGSGCNACEQLEGDMRGMIMSIDPDGGDARVYANGLRNAVGITWAEGVLYATANGVDHLGPDAPDEVMYRIREGGHYGWPYCYESDGVLYPETSRTWGKPISCKDAPLSFTAFDPHAAPLGLAYFGDDAHPVLKNSFLVALHGSFEPEIGNGYELVRVSKDGTQDIFMDGFLGEGGKRFARPVHILQKDENSFFMTDDYAGRIYYLYASP